MRDQTEFQRLFSKRINIAQLLIVGIGIVQFCTGYAVTVFLPELYNPPVIYTVSSFLWIGIGILPFFLRISDKYSINMGFGMLFLLHIQLIYLAYRNHFEPNMVLLLMGLYGFSSFIVGEGTWYRWLLLVVISFNCVLLVATPNLAFDPLLFVGVLTSGVVIVGIYTSYVQKLLSLRLEESRRMEAKAEHRLSLIQSLMDQSNDAVFILQPRTGKLVDFNQRACAQLGYTREELAKLFVHDIDLVYNDAEKVAAVAENTLTHGEYTFNSSHKRKDGSSFPVEIRSKYMEHKDEVYVVSVARDITERIKQQEALQKREQRYRTLVELMNEGIILADLEEKTLFVNARMCEILGLKESELVGHKMYEVIESDSVDLKDFFKSKTRIRKEEQVSDQYELKLRHPKTHETIWVQAAGAPYLDEHGKTVGTFAVVTDITERKKAEIKLQEKNRELDAFVYKASHDLKGPLASIMGLATIAMNETTDAMSKQYLGLIHKSTKRLDRILLDLIDLTRVNKAAMDVKVIDIAKLIEEIIESLRHQPESKAVEFSVDIQLKSPLKSDRKLMISILQNLIVNGINYQRSDANPPIIDVKIWEERERIEFCVEDNGVGMPKEIQEKVFDMFFRGNTTSKGSGLGLYIVKNSIERLQGRFRVESEPGVGTKFFFSLPKNMRRIE